MTTDASFLRAILDTPDDDGPRLVYADWLEERGEVRGEFIRVQCRLAKPPWTRQDLIRERELFEILSGCLREELGDSWVFPNRSTQIRLDSHPVNIPTMGVSYCVRRGFVEEVTLTLSDYMIFAPALFAAAPVLKVTLTDREPHEYDHLHCWFYGTHERFPECSLPDSLWALVVRHPDCEVHGKWADFCTLELAHAALFDALVAYGRSVATGMTHEAKCGKCGGYGSLLGAAPDRGNPKCSDCRGTGKVRRPGLRPIVRDQTTIATIRRHIEGEVRSGVADAGLDPTSVQFSESELS